MIVSFEVANYLSFAGTTRVDLSVGAHAPDDYNFVSMGKSRLAKIAAIYGANASGKTNLIRALPALADFITKSFGYRLDDTMPFRPHFFSEDKPIRFQIEFEIPKAGKHYRYALEATPSRVLSESLRVKTSKLYSRVFERKWEGDGYRLTGLGERHLPNLRENVSWLAWLAQYNVPEAIDVVAYFNGLQSNIKGRGQRVPALFSGMEAVDFYRSHPEFSKLMVSQLNRWDIDIQEVEYRQMDAKADGDGSPWMAYCVHKQGERVAKLPIFSESSGTLGLFSLLSIVLPVLHSGGIAVVDELEADLHPRMVEALLSLFLMPESNPNNAQLLFTTHADWLMNLLHKAQIFLVEKADSGSELARLSEIRGIEARENFSARYRSGAYGAVPEID